MNKVLLTALTRGYKWEADWKFFYVFEPSQQKKEEAWVAYYCLVFKDAATFNKKIEWEKVDADIVRHNWAEKESIELAIWYIIRNQHA